MITRSSIAFEDFLGSSIVPQVMPPCFNVKVVLWWRRWGGRRTRFWLPRPSPPGSESGQGYFIRIVMKRKKMINKNWQHSSTSVIVRAKFEWILSKAITLLFWTDSIYNINININISTDIKLIFFERQQWQQRSIFFCFSSPQADCPRPERGGGSFHLFSTLLFSVSALIPMETPGFLTNPVLQVCRWFSQGNEELPGFDPLPVLKLQQHHVRHWRHQGKVGRRQVVHPMKHGKLGKRLPSVLNALSQLDLFDDEADGGALRQQGGLQQRDLAWYRQIFRVRVPTWLRPTRLLSRAAG